MNLGESDSYNFQTQIDVQESSFQYDYSTEQFEQDNNAGQIIDEHNEQQIDSLSSQNSLSSENSNLNYKKNKNKLMDQDLQVDDSSYLPISENLPPENVSSENIQSENTYNQTYNESHNSNQNDNQLSTQISLNDRYHQSEYSNNNNFYQNIQNYNNELSDDYKLSDDSNFIEKIYNSNEGKFSFNIGYNQENQNKQQTKIKKDSIECLYISNDDDMPENSSKTYVIQDPDIYQRQFINASTYNHRPYALEETQIQIEQNINNKNRENISDSNNNFDDPPGDYNSGDISDDDGFDDDDQYSSGDQITNAIKSYTIGYLEDPTREEISVELQKYILPPIQVQSETSIYNNISNQQKIKSLNAVYNHFLLLQQQLINSIFVLVYASVQQCNSLQRKETIQQCIQIY